MAYVTQIKQKDLKLIKIIGEGGFSSVYEAKWKQSLLKQQEVAAKRLHKIDKHELEILCRLDHPNIVKLIGVVDERCDFLLVMELCKGGSLRSYLNKSRGNQLPLQQILDWAKQAARPIKYLKEMKIVHKDIKSPNYLIAEGNTLKLGDFGSAKNIKVTMSNATATASYAWMAPELLKDQALSPSYDIYSYGVVVWELWSTDIPFEGADPVNIIWRVCNNNERPPIPTDCPAILADLMRQCWDSDWHKRPSIDYALTVLSNAEPGLKGEQILDGTWLLQKELDHEGAGDLSAARSITVNPNGGDIGVADSKLAQVKVYSSGGTYKFSLDMTQGLTPGRISMPSNILANAEGNYYITDRTPFVKVFNVNGIYKGKWVAVSPDNRFSDAENTTLFGLAMDSKGHLLVGECNYRYISTHRQDGSHIASFRIRIGPYFLAVTSQDTIVVNDWYHNVVRVLDTKGQVLNIVQPPNEIRCWEPYGVCCYDNIILICNNAPSHGICCFSVTGEYLGFIKNMKHLHCLAIARESKTMMVASRNRVQIHFCQT